MSDQFTRWLCAKCGHDGIDSWNKAMFDGVAHDGALPAIWILGDNCQRCCWPCVVMYTAPDAAPRAIFGPVGLKDPLPFSYEPDAFELIQADPAAGMELKPADSRDGDWSRGCLAARGQLQ